MDALDAVTFDTHGYESRGDRGATRVWYTPTGDGLGLYYFALPPDVPASLDDVDALRRAYRDPRAEPAMGLIELDVVTLDGCRAIQSLVKVPQQPTGRTYIGSLTLPFREYSYVLKVQCAESAPTGLRDAWVFDQLLADGTVTFDAQHSARGWLADAYDPSLQGPLICNRSEAAAYDAQFPVHPLSRVRATLRHLVATVRVSDAVRAAAPFEG